MANYRTYSSPYPAPHIPTHVSVSQFLLQCNPDDVENDRVVLCDFDNPSRSVTYGGIRKNAGRDAAAFKKVLGLKEGDTVCIYAENSVSWASIAHAVMWAGGCFW
jgi:4-coumarate--CoA ligase